MWTLLHTRPAEHPNLKERKKQQHVFKPGFWPSKSIAGQCDQASPGCCSFQRIVAAAAVMLRSLLTVTPTADLHHITKCLILFPADRVALQSSHQEDWPGATRYIIKIVKELPSANPSAVPRLENFLILLCNFGLAFRLISYWSSSLKYLWVINNSTKLLYIIHFFSPLGLYSIFFQFLQNWK